MDVSSQLKKIKRGTVEIISEQELSQKLEASLKSKTPLRVKTGFDPTTPDLHLGHTVLLRKLRHFQELGHKVIFLIGDYTAIIGDPSGQSVTRKMLTADRVKENAKTYLKQVSKILDTEDKKVFELRYNSEWFGPGKGDVFKLIDFIDLASRYNVARLIERDDFSKRLKEGKPISVSEFLYPLMQAYDSVKLGADIEIGGSDQKFNLLVGRDIQKSFGKVPQAVITMPLLEGLDGKLKMSKSYDNYVGINEKPAEMFGKLMSSSDELMYKYYELLTDEDLEKVRQLHPREAKLRLAQEIVGQYHGKSEAETARREFENIFSQGQLPSDMPLYKLTSSKGILEILVDSGLIKTKNEGRRLIQEGAVSLDEQKITDPNKILLPQEGILKVGSRRFLKLVVS
ncbi:MAG: tyrosine--tRNA ligase [Candidatus Omnitrophota bacterium]